MHIQPSTFFPIKTGKSRGGKNRGGKSRGGKSRGGKKVVSGISDGS